jgi:hypothetical protein
VFVCVCLCLESSFAIAFRIIANCHFSVASHSTHTVCPRKIRPLTISLQSLVTSHLDTFFLLAYSPPPQGIRKWYGAGYGLDDRRFESRQELGIFLFTTASRPALGPTQPPIKWVSGALSLEVKRPGREAGHSPPSSEEVKNACSYTSIPQYAFMAWCSVKAQGQLYRVVTGSSPSPLSNGYQGLFPWR